MILTGYMTSAQPVIDWTSGRPDGHAPIGLMGDHTHSRGEWMVSYRYMRMEMEGMREGTDALNNEDVLADFMVTPLNMPMDMHMVGVMYALSDQLTLMAMGNFIQLDMDHRTRMGGSFTTRSNGFGDTRFSALYKFFDAGNKRLHANLGISIPTGSIDQTDVTPASAPNEAQLPYPMQIGSGTWDLMPGITYLAQRVKTSFGAQLMGTIRLAENERNYRFGHILDANAWVAYRLSDYFSASVRLHGRLQGEIEGADPAYAGAVAMNMVPTVFPENFGGTQLYAGGGINFFVPGGALKDLRLGLELELPLYRNINGPQLETDYLLTTGIQYAF